MRLIMRLPLLLFFVSGCLLFSRAPGTAARFTGREDFQTANVPVLLTEVGFFVHFKRPKPLRNACKNIKRKDGCFPSLLFAGTL